MWTVLGTFLLQLKDQLVTTKLIRVAFRTAQLKVFGKYDLIW